MTDFKRGIKKITKLVEQLPDFVPSGIPSNNRLTKKAGRPEAESYIRRKTIKGRYFYYFCRGTDKEIYLGTADSILKKVKGYGKENMGHTSRTR